MSEQITNGTDFNIYYSSYNIPYNNPNIKIEGAKYGMIVCKDNLSYNLLFVNESGTPYLLSDNVNKFTAEAPIKLLNSMANGKERKIKLDYDTSFNSFLTVNNYGELMVNRNKLNSYYAGKFVEDDVIMLSNFVMTLQEENDLLKSQIDILNRKFDALNIDKDKYISTNLDIWLEPSQNNKLCIRKKDNEDITYDYDLLYSRQIKLNLYSTYSYYEVDEYNWNYTYDFIKQVTEYSYFDQFNEKEPDIIPKNNNAYILIKNAYIKNKTNEYYYNIDLNNSDNLSYYFNYFDNTFAGYIGKEDLGNQRVSYTYNLWSNQIDINQCNTIDLQYFSKGTFADYPFEYIEDKKTFNMYNYYPVNKFSINTIDNFNIYNEDIINNGSYASLKIICSYFNDNNVLESTYYNMYDVTNPNRVVDLYLDKHIKQLSSIQIYPCVYDNYETNSNLKLSSRKNNNFNNVGITDIETENNSAYTISYTLNFDNVSYLEFKLSEESFYNKLKFTLSDLYLSISNPESEYIWAKEFKFSIYKNNYIDKNNIIDTTIPSTQL